MISQIIWGGLMLSLCTLIHISLLTTAIMLLRHLSSRVEHLMASVRIITILGGALLLIVLSHTLQVWIWALSFVLLGAIPEFSKAVYFSLVTYTTLGYGDVILSDNVRLYAAMAAVTGLLNFGLSTAFLVGVFSKLLPVHMSE